MAWQNCNKSLAYLIKYYTGRCRMLRITNNSWKARQVFWFYHVIALTINLRKTAIMDNEHVYLVYRPRKFSGSFPEVVIQSSFTYCETCRRSRLSVSLPRFETSFWRLCSVFPASSPASSHLLPALLFKISNIFVFPVLMWRMANEKKPRIREFYLLVVFNETIHVYFAKRLKEYR